MAVSYFAYLVEFGAIAITSAVYTNLFYSTVYTQASSTSLLQCGVKLFPRIYLSIEHTFLCQNTLQF